MGLRPLVDNSTQLNTDHAWDDYWCNLKKTTLQSYINICINMNDTTIISIYLCIYNQKNRSMKGLLLQQIVSPHRRSCGPCCEGQQVYCKPWRSVQPLFHRHPTEIRNFNLHAACLAGRLNPCCQDGCELSQGCLEHSGCRTDNQWIYTSNA